jgi:hypothetical protein
MKTWRYDSTILNLGTNWRWVVSFTSLPLYPRGKSPQYQLYKTQWALETLWKRQIFCTERWWVGTAFCNVCGPHSWYRDSQISGTNTKTTAHKIPANQNWPSHKNQFQARIISCSVIQCVFTSHIHGARSRKQRTQPLESVALTTRHPLSAESWNELRRQAAVVRSV